MVREAGSSDKREGPSTRSLTVGSLVSLAGLLASGVAMYSTIQTDLTSLKRGEVYQERINDRTHEELKNLRAELKEARMEQRDTMREFGEKVDRLVQHWPSKRRD